MTRTELTIVKKEKSRPVNYAHFYLRSPALRKEIRVVLCNGTAIDCSRHRNALASEPCECMRLVMAAPDKDQYWEPYVNSDDYGDLIDAARS